MPLTKHDIKEKTDPETRNFILGAFHSKPAMLDPKISLLTGKIKEFDHAKTFLRVHDATSCM